MGAAQRVSGRTGREGRGSPQLPSGLYPNSLLTEAIYVAAGSSEDRTFQIDLKGVLYYAAVVPLAGTALVLNLGTTEAKVGQWILGAFVWLPHFPGHFPVIPYLFSPEWYPSRWLHSPDAH